MSTENFAELSVHMNSSYQVNRRKRKTYAFLFFGTRRIIVVLYVFQSSPGELHLGPMLVKQPTMSVSCCGMHCAVL